MYMIKRIAHRRHIRFYIYIYVYIGFYIWWRYYT